MHVACWNAVCRIAIAFPLRREGHWGAISREQKILDLRQLRAFRVSYLERGEASIPLDTLRRL